jgi:hypothetical protein
MNIMTRAEPPFDPLRFCPVPRDEDAERRAMIAEAAYFRAERHGFTPGHELEDWLAAEQEVDARLRAPDPAPKAKVP